MHARLLLVVLLLSFTTAGWGAGSGAPDAPQDAARDAQLSRRIVGTWLEGEVPLEVSVFKADGSYEGTVYESPERVGVVATMKGRWYIRQGVLYNVYSETEPKIEEAQGPVRIGEIIRLNADSLTLTDEHGGPPFTKTREGSGANR